MLSQVIGWSGFIALVVFLLIAGAVAFFGTMNQILECQDDERGRK